MSMGFPDWTLWGMGLSAAGALLALVLAMLGQSPNALKRLGLSRLRLDLRVRSFTAYALALLLLATGFFWAGVPLGAQDSQDILASDLSPEGTPVSTNGEPTISEVVQETGESTAPATPQTGAFSGPPTGTITTAETVQIDIQQTPTPTITSPVDVTSDDFPRSVPESSPTNTRTPTATATPTPTSTPTPSPTLTPTPISGRTGVVQSGGSSIWLKRMPDGNNLVLVADDEIVLILTGHANKGGILWQEVSTLQGVTGWIQDDLLDIAE